jgi:hypothetical protein
MIRSEGSKSDMRAYKGLVNGNTIVLEEDPGLPSGYKTLVLLKPLSKDAQEETVKRQLELLKQGFDMGRVLVRSREEIYER